MAKMNRRDFLQRTAGAMAAGAMLPALSGVASAQEAAAAPAATGAALPKATDIRTLGKTGLQCTYLGVGTGTRGRAPGETDQTDLPHDQYIGILEHAYQQGLSYFDLADRYGSHSRMREVMEKSVPRDKVMLLSKVWSREPDAVKADLERFREELNTDVVDVVLMHCIRGGEENWPETLRPAMDVLSEAKAKGHIRAHGVSCHILPALERVADEPWVDVVLARINPFGSHMDGPVEQVVPILQKIHDAGKGILAMKVLGEGDPNVVAKMDESLRFVGGLGCIDAMTIGFLKNEEMDEIITKINAAATA